VGDPRAAGEDALDVDTLKNVASTTGGIFSHATDRKQLSEIYRKLDELETRKAQTISHRPRRDVYWWPLAVALVASLMQQISQLVLHQVRARARARREAELMGGATMKPETQPEEVTA
jgi:Ca-activated chloride channel family protein